MWFACSGVDTKRASSDVECAENSALFNRRNVVGAVYVMSGIMIGSTQAKGAGLPPEEKLRLCDEIWEKELENVHMVTIESGLQYKDIKVGVGPCPPVGFQVLTSLSGLFPENSGLFTVFDQLAFPKGLTSAPGRPRVASNSPVIFDVNLLYIPGIESDEEE